MTEGLTEETGRSYTVQSWQAEAGMPQNSVNALLQSEDGYIWVGTYNGLARFDGQRFTTFDAANTKELPNSRVTSLFQDSTGSIWIGLESGSVSRLKQGVFEHFDLSADWQPSSINGIAEDARGDIWLLSQTGMFLRIRDRQKIQPFRGIGEEPGLSPHLYTDASRRIIVSRNGVIGELLDGAWLIQRFNEPPETYFTRACLGPEGEIIVLGEGFLRGWRNGRWHRTLAPINIPGTFVPCILMTKGGDLLLGTADRGLLIAGEGSSTWVNREHGLANNWVRCLMEDREGNIWVGTRGGLSVLRERKVQMLAPADRWQHNVVLSTSGGKGGIWAATEGGGLYHLHQGGFTVFNSSRGLTSGYVWSVLEERRGVVWAGTWSEGLFRMPEGQDFAVPSALKDLKHPVTALLEDESEDGSVWIGTGAGLYHFKGERLESFRNLGGCAAGNIRALCWGPDGNLWLGTMGAGFGALRDGKLTNYLPTSGEAFAFVLSLSAEKDGTVWIGSLENGLGRLKNGLFSRLTSQNNLPSESISSIQADDRGNLWFNSNRGIFTASKEDLHRVCDSSAGFVPFVRYGKEDGLSSLAGSAGFTPSGFKSADGRIHFPVADGIAICDPTQRKRNEVAPGVEIEEVILDGEVTRFAGGSHSKDRSWDVRAGHKVIEIRFTALSFRSPEDVQFLTRLEGLNDAWIAPGSRQVSFTYLPPGDYRFRVKAGTRDGVWNEQGASLKLRIAPFFWQTWWFNAGIALSGGLVVAGTVFWSTRQRMHKRIQRLAKDRELDTERARIAQDIHDDLGASLTRIGMLSQNAMDYLNEPERANKVLGQIYSTAKELTRAMDEIVWAVNPKHDTLDSLLNYITRFAYDLVGAGEMRCRLDVPMQLPDCQVRSEIRHNLFLAFKEALHNAVKHSKATEVRVSVTLQKGLLMIEVLDNGRGFAEAAIEAGDGLENITKRLKLVGGTSAVLSTPGNGTRVILRAPVSGNHVV